MSKPLKLQQGQIWKQGDTYLRIVRLERLAVEYKTTPSPAAKSGLNHQVTKKEFCRLIKAATLLPAAPAPGPRPVQEG
ncbi:MAG: hypothetical protein RL514_1448 [Verrucomicrobiota bacterium]|jgi:hypothetical protein